MHDPAPQNPYQPPTTELGEAEPQALMPQEKVLKIAGIMLMINGIVVLLERMLMPTGGIAGGIAPAVIDILIAASFLKGNDKYRTFAIFRVCAGFLLFGGLAISQGDYFTPVFAAVGSAGFLLVLIGSPGRGRVIAGGVLFGLYLSLELLGLSML